MESDRPLLQTADVRTRPNKTDIDTKAIGILQFSALSGNVECMRVFSLEHLNTEEFDVVSVINSAG
jgi:hypothetical protein